MNILQILPELNVGGVETGTVDLARHLVRLGHKAVVVSGGGPLVRDVEACGALHYQLPVQNKSIVAMLKNVPRLIEIIKKEEIDIVHTRSRAPAWVAYWAGRATNRVFITTCHGYYRRHPFSAVMGWGKRVIVLSNSVARHMIDDFGVPHERIRLIPRSVDLAKFGFASPEKRRGTEFHVGIIGRITPLKGHLVFMKAMSIVARSVPELKIWVVGEASASRQAYKDQLQVLTRRLGLSPVTQFLGTQRDIPGILANLDCLVLATTTQEAFGRVIIEAHAAGVPVVATRVGGVVDIIDDGESGLLVPPGDARTMAEAVVRLAEDVGLCTRLAYNAYAKVKEKFTIELMVKNTVAVYEEALHNFNILVIKLSSLGDVILSTAALKALRQRFGSGYRISLLVGEDAREIVLRCPYIDELLVCDLAHKDKGLRGLLHWGRVLRRKCFDIVVDLQNNRASHILARLSLAPERYGYDNKKFARLLNHRIKDELSPVDPLTHQFRVLRMLGIELKGASLELWPGPQDDAYADELLKEQWLSGSEKLVGINVSASVRWGTKQWPLRHMAALCTELARKKMRILLTGTESDAAAAEVLLAAVRQAKPINACGKTSVNQLACLIKRCSVFISADSAPLHIAAAMKTPFVALFGPTDPRRHLAPAKNYAMIRKGLPCSPCYEPSCKHTTCMESITPEEVLAAVERLLKET